MGLLGSASAVGVRVIERVARTTSGAAAVPCTQHACCCLAKAPIAPLSCYSKCQDLANYTLRAWGCCKSGIFYSCQECTNGSTCGNGTKYACSAYEQVSSC